MGFRGTLGVLPVVAAVLVSSASGGAETARVVLATSVRVGSLVLTIPGGFSRHDTRRQGRLIGVLVTDYGITLHSPTLTKGVFSAKGVALVVGQSVEPHVAVPLLRLPLDLDQLHRPQYHSDGTAWNGALRFHDAPYTISFWAGRTASLLDRAALLHALMSIQAR